MKENPAQAAHDAAEFELDEKPTNPSAPAPEDLAIQTWLASARGANQGPLRSATSRFRAVAIAAVDGGAARVSHVDLQEADAAAHAPESEASAGASNDEARADERDKPASERDAIESGTRPVVSLPESVPSAPAVEVPAGEAPAVEEAAVAESHVETPAEAPSGAPIGAAPAARPLFGPRGTVRIAPRADHGPTGTVRMPARPTVRTEPDDAAARRTTRGRSLILAGIGLLCALNVGWILLNSAPRTATAPTGATAAPVSDPQAVQAPATADPAIVSRETNPSAATTPEETSSMGAPPRAPRPVTPPAKRANPRPKRATPPSSVF